MYDTLQRERKAQTMIAVLRDYFGSDLTSLKALDVGASTGIIDNYLADHLGHIIGIDIDAAAIDFAVNSYSKPNLLCVVADGTKLSFQSASFDVVICAHIYEHVPDARQLLVEIHRVLKPDGVCYFTAGNRLNIREPHYNLPFLSVIPRPLAHIYMRLAGKGAYYYEKHSSCWGLKRLVKGFEIIDYTGRIIEDPERFHTAYMMSPESSKAKIASLVVSYAYWLMPGYIWLLKKFNPAGAE
jgi:ubiquinone/menaquinone biosynthesis C-methylase UbiE